MDDFKERIKNCLQDEPAFCTAACPFGLDVRDFMEKLQRGGFNMAYRSYLNTVGFPEIVNALCKEPCKECCPRGEVDSAIQMRELEKAAVRFAKNRNPNSYNLPPKGKRIAIVGGGISGLACALRLASKKYEVVVYEKTDRLGGHLWNELPSELFLEEIKRQFQFENYELHLNTEIKSLDEIDAAAIYVATGENGANFGLTEDPKGAFASNRPGVFLGGRLLGGNTVEAIRDGLQAVIAIERYIKTGYMNQPIPEKGTRIKLDPKLIRPVEAIHPEGADGFSETEAVGEAKRCLRCTCDACVKHCDLMGYYSKFPRRIGEEVEITIHPGTLDGNGTVATRLIATCTHCGNCAQVCPEKIDTGEFLRTSHQTMQEQGAMPWPFHDFSLRDMEFTNSEQVRLAELPEGKNTSRYLFFPGCQMGASDPRYVLESYAFLKTKHPDTGILVQCCGAPADWSGEELKREDVMKSIREEWNRQGKPEIIFGCPSCASFFKRFLPEIKGRFLYEFFSVEDVQNTNRADGTLWKEAQNDKMETSVSVFDPCSSKYSPELQKQIRTLVSEMGYINEPLSYEGQLAKCCSWGGHVQTANKTFSKKAVEARIRENDLPYIAYCVNCRDIFDKAGKACVHILDLLFSLDRLGKPQPTMTQRRENRLTLKKELLKQYWTEKQDGSEERADSAQRIEFIEGLKEKISDEMMLEEEILKTVEYCESSGRKLRNKETGHFIGHHVIGCTTFWVEYERLGEEIIIHKAYSHRMTIEEGEHGGK